jgi:hypothetical protein
MSKHLHLTKRCERCGWHGQVATRQRRCRQPRSGFPGSYWCYGKLVTMWPIPDRGRILEDDDELMDPELEMRDWLQNTRRGTAARMKACRARLDAALDDIDRAVVRANEWRRQLRRAEELNAQTDDQLIEGRLKRKAGSAKAIATAKRKRSIPRGIRLEGS